MVRYCWRCAAALPAVPPTTCVGCGEVHYVNPKPCGCAVVLGGGGGGAGGVSSGCEALLLLRARDPDAGRWTIPGGFCEADEHPMHAAERELYEEVGVRGRAVGYLGAWMDTYGPPEADGLGITTVVSGYLVALPDAIDLSALRLDPAEVREARWWPVDALPEPLAFPGHVGPMIRVAAELRARGGGPPLGQLPDRGA